MNNNQLAKVPQKKRKPQKQKKQKKKTMNSPNSIPAARAQDFKNRAPSIRQEKDKWVISHKELITTLQAAGGNLEIPPLYRFRMNPASQKTFPWLSTIAPSFECYKFRKLKFDQKTRVGSTQVGSCWLSIDYDAADQAPQNEFELASNIDCKESAMWKDFSVVCKPERMNAAYKQHYTMDDDRFTASLQDQKTIDVGFLQCAFEAPAATVFAKLWAEYEVEFTIPQFPTTPAMLGGAGMNKVTGFNINTANVFANGNILTLNNEIQEPIVTLLPNSSFPGPNILQFLRDWEGFVSSSITGTGLTNIGFPRITGQGSVNPNPAIAGIINGAQTAGSSQYYVTAKRGDLLGADTILGSTLTGFIYNLGGSGVF